MAKNDTKNTQICLEKAQNVLCNFIEEEFVALLKVVLGHFVKTSSTGVYQSLQDRFNSEMLNYLSKDFFDSFVDDARIKTGTSDTNSFMNLIFLFTEFYNTLGLSWSEKLKNLRKKSPDSSASTTSTNQEVILPCTSTSEMEIFEDTMH